MFQFIRVIVLNIASIIQAHHLKEPYHTSILTGHMWVLELLVDIQNIFILSL